MNGNNNDALSGETLLVWEEFIAVCGCPPDLADEAREMGWLAPAQPGAAPLFSQEDVYRIRKLQRICEDFELPVVGGSIIVDLLARVDELERMVEELRAGLT